eukprot:14691785-Alexandrium_andersonii.AAC.1
MAFGSACNGGDDLAAARPITESELFGAEQDDTYMKKRQRRFKKAHAWLSHADTPLLQCVGLALLFPLVAILGTFFEAARFDSTGASGMME